MTALAYDTSCWPLIALALPADATQLDVAGLKRSLDAVFSRRAKFVSITDASAVARLPGAKARAALGEWTKSIEPMSRRYQVANALVVPGGLARGVLTAVQWMAPPVAPTTVCATVAEGVAFLREHALRQDVDVAPLDRFLAGRGPLRAT